MTATTTVGWLCEHGSWPTAEARIEHRLATGCKPVAEQFASSATPTESGKFEVIPNGFGGTTTRRVSGTRSTSTAAPSARPQYRKVTATASRATQPQTDYIHKLLAERAGDPQAEVIRQRLNTWREQGGVTFAAATKTIDDLKAIPRRTAAAVPAIRVNRFGGKCESCTRFVAPEEGRLSKADDGKWQVWHLDGECPSSDFPFPFGRYAVEMDGTLKFFVASTDGLFAQASDDLFPVKGKEHRDEVIAAIAADPPAASARFGQEIGRCGRCNRTLTDETSRAMGIGPVCATKGWD